MTYALTTTPLKIMPVTGFTSAIIQNGAAAACFITQRAPLAGATESADPTTDPGYSLAAGETITWPFTQPIWIKGTGSQNVTVVAAA